MMSVKLNAEKNMENKSMKEKIKTICLILITLSIIFIAVSYFLEVQSKNKYYELQRIEKCSEFTINRENFNRCMKNDFDWKLQNTGLEKLLNK